MAHFIVKKKMSTDFSNAYSNVKIIYNKVVRTQKFDASFRISYFTGSSQLFVVL